MCITFALQLFGVPEDKAVQKPDESEVLEGISCVLDDFPLDA